jgi:undecaprenyl-diphosphatase
VWDGGAAIRSLLGAEWVVRWDALVTAWVHGHAAPAGLAFFSVFTVLGSLGVWTLTLCVALWLWRDRHRMLLGVWLTANLGGMLLQAALKEIVHRERPGPGAAYLSGHSYGFPSGHAMQSTIAYVMLVFVLSAVDERWRARRGVLLAGALALVMLICVSRLYLGVHHPSDVVGGVVVGGGVIFLCTTVLRTSVRRAPTQSAGNPR